MFPCTTGEDGTQWNCIVREGTFGMNGAAGTSGTQIAGLGGYAKEMRKKSESEIKKTVPSRAVIDYLQVIIRSFSQTIYENYMLLICYIYIYSLFRFILIK